MKLFCKSQFPHNFVNVFVILVIKTCPTLGIIPTLNNVITCRVYATRQVSCKVIAFSINLIPDRNQQGHRVFSSAKASQDQDLVASRSFRF